MKKNIISTIFCGLELITSKAFNNNGIVIIVAAPILFNRYVNKFDGEIIRVTKNTTIEDIKDKQVLFFSPYVLHKTSVLFSDILKKENTLVDYIFDTINHSNIKNFTLFFNLLKKSNQKSNIYLNIDNTPSILFLIRKNINFFNFSIFTNSVNSNDLDFIFRKNRNWLKLIKTSLLYNCYNYSSMFFYEFNSNLIFNDILTIINNPINNNIYSKFIMLSKDKNFSFESLYDFIVNQNLKNHIYHYLEKFYKNNFDDYDKIGKYIFSQLSSVDYKKIPAIFEELNLIINKNKNLTSDEYIVLFNHYFNNLNNFNISEFIENFNNLSLKFKVIDNKILVKINDYNVYRLISPSKWCTNLQESFFNYYKNAFGEFYMIFDFNLNYTLPESIIGFNYSSKNSSISCAFDKFNKNINPEKLDIYTSYLNKFN